MLRLRFIAKMLRSWLSNDRTPVSNYHNYGLVQCQELHVLIEGSNLRKTVAVLHIMIARP